MVSFNFPDMLSSAKANLIEDKEATISNIRLLLASWKTSLFGDPYFGTNIKRFIYEQNDIILRDLIIDDILLSLQEFVPQIVTERKKIKIEQRGKDVFATVDCTSRLDSLDLSFTIKLTEDN